MLVVAQIQEGDRFVVVRCSSLLTNRYPLINANCQNQEGGNIPSCPQDTRFAAVVIPSRLIVTHLLMSVARIQEVGCFFAVVCGNSQFLNKS